MSASLMPHPRQQFFTASGVPLAAGLIYTYAAGTSTPQAAYTDSTGAVALSNPIVLDAGGFASIWLSAANYKIVAMDANSVTQWTVDNVSSVSQAELQAGNTFSSLTVTGNAAIGGNETVSGTLTAASLVVTGSGTVGGTLTADSLAVTGNATVGGTLGVTGDTSLGTLAAGDTTVSGLNIGAQTLTAFITALIPALSALDGTFVISNITSAGGWGIFTFGSTAGTRIKIAFGSGTIASGSTITLPSGFSTGQFIPSVSLSSVNSTSGNNLDGITCSVTVGGVVTATGNDNSGHVFAGTANWMALAWLTGV